MRPRSMESFMKRVHAYYRESRFALLFGLDESCASAKIVCLGGRLAQLGEHRVRNAGVGGSNPLPSTKFLRFLTIPT